MAKGKTFANGQPLTAADINTFLNPDVPAAGAAYDTGWVPCVINGANWTNVGSEPVMVRRIGLTVYMRGAIHNNTFAPNTTMTVGSVPSGFAPSQRAPFNVSLNTSANLFARIETNGNITVGWYTTASTTATGSWYGFNNCVYIIN